MSENSEEKADYVSPVRMRNRRRLSQVREFLMLIRLWSLAKKIAFHAKIKTTKFILSIWQIGLSKQYGPSSDAAEILYDQALHCLSLMQHLSETHQQYRKF